MSDDPAPVDIDGMLPQLQGRWPRSCSISKALRLPLTGDSEALFAGREAHLK